MARVPGQRGQSSAPATASPSAAGHVFHTKSDTECIVHAWEQWGEKCVERSAPLCTLLLFEAFLRKVVQSPAVLQDVAAKMDASAVA